ncbi:ISAs1 family transposase [Cytophagaceae bacterium ABcell3]|nr:ISAs1 family transposase [Cytophagaceae bacterium ABcell3]WMJ74002.1 ISAs1 family transposase [Cytophagaceae bacterium ABcell3]WMJ75528.1 ISAs1 family transposase [Cytophagaceae bacterium ABcell3]
MSEPRRTIKGNFKYPLQEILFLCVSAVVSNAGDWHEIVTFGKEKIEWLRKFFPYRNGVPSHDTLERVFAKIVPDEFGECFVEWASTMFRPVENETINIDGKRIRGSYDSRKGANALHMVSAYATANHLTLGQLAVPDKSNEITAIPKLLDMITVENTTVTIDAMGCQKDITEKIIRKNGDYVIAVKNNQKELFQQIDRVFEKQGVADVHKQIDTGHGRLESRTCKLINDLRFIDAAHQWCGIKSVARLESERYNKLTGKQEQQVRYYISSHDKTAEWLNGTIRNHWAIENKLHWSLDVVFGEDSSRRRKGYTAQNFHILNKVSLILLQKHKSKETKPKKRYKAIFNDAFREEILDVF